MARRKKHEEHQNHEAWAIPYGDLVTLLLAFFVVMYAISQVNAGKYRVLSDSLVVAFRGSPRTLDPVQVGEQQGGSQSDLRRESAPPLPLRSDPHQLAPGTPSDPTDIRVKEVPPVPMPVLGAEPIANETSNAMHRVADAVENAMQDLIASHTVVVRRHDLFVEVELRTDVLFSSGSALLAPGASSVIQRLANSLQNFPNSVRVEGYTDDRPINTPQYPSNWELSAARAATVVQVLARHGVSPTRLSVLGFGEYRPVASNASADGRNANRRVLLVIQSTNDPPGTTATTATTAGSASTASHNGHTAEPGEEAAPASPLSAPATTTTTTTATPIAMTQTPNVASHSTAGESH